MAGDIEARFDAPMMEIYQRALNEAHYPANRFLQMLHDRRGLETAQILLHAGQVSDGYTALWERGRLDLTVEALILQPRWHELFTDEERQIARTRLQQYAFNSEGTGN